MAITKNESTEAVLPGKEPVFRDAPVVENSSPANVKTWRYWGVIIALCIVSLLVALEGTVVSTALPSITKELGGGETYVWVINAYFLSSTAFQPLYGQTANIFGRRWLIISAVALFILGSGIAGGAHSMTMLIAGRTVQGIGGGGCSMMIDMIICDLVPLRERGSVMGYIFGAATVATALGPFIGGILVQKSSWRWVFYINIPVASLGLLLIVLFLHVKWQKERTLMQKLRRVDFAGNAVFIAATISILIALTNAGTVYSWSNWRTILPIVLGFAGLGVFVLYEWSGYCAEPTLPPVLFTNRTSATGFALTMLHAMFLYWEIYFLPVYFQAVCGSSPARSGVQLLPTVINLMVFAGVGGVLMEKLGRYLPLHAAAFALMTLGFGLFTLLDRHSSTAEWVIFQIIYAAGAGLPIGTLLPSVQAELKEEYTATATGTWAVLRSFGTIWGIAVSAAIFNNRFVHLIGNIDDQMTRAALSGGRAYELATKAFMSTLDTNQRLKGQVTEVYTESLKLTWQVAIALAGFGFLLVFLQREVTLRTELETEFGLVVDNKGDVERNDKRLQEL
ncbi:2b786199-f3c9-4435-9480-7ab88f4ac46b [Sclerotinia trifoliorum]|uniref:2b786199-f3c9-4435-9480-7ab88f4ac46b n=1 Tax=Sclerotinia trifoliorum TaxID=28548 RepID=A0A8H2ZPW6_9HELO|nr:2b786199-f3c9-4435-9480-7ab88f4ac46b [Sclerotinia trifoliorum]